MGLGERETRGAGWLWLATATIAGALAWGVMGQASAVDARDAGTQVGEAPVAIDCESRVQVGLRPVRIRRSDRRAGLLAGPAFFRDVKRHRRAFRPPTTGLRRAKAPLEIRGGRNVTVTVSPPAGRRAVIAYGLDAGGTARGTSVEFRPCPRTDRRTPFVGGFQVDGRMCLGLRLDVEGRPDPTLRTLSFGRGDRCRPIVVTRQEGGFPARCRPKRVGTRLDGLSRALRTVNGPALRRLWGWRRFERFAVVKRNRPVFVARHFRRGLRDLRRRGGLRLSFKEVEIMGPGRVAVEGSFHTRAGKLRKLSARATLACGRPGMVRLRASVGRHAADVADCPPPTEPVPGNAMILCMRAESPTVRQSADP